jgi:DnaJ family protein C protein 3
LIELANVNFYLLNQPEGALANLKQCLHYDPEQKQCKTAFRQLKKLNKTIKSIQDSMEKKKYSTASNQLIGTATRQGIIEQVREELQHVKDQYIPTSSSSSSSSEQNIPQQLLLQCYETACRLQKLLNKDDTKIIDWCTQTLELQGDHVDALTHRGEVYLNQHEYEKAIQDLQAAHDVTQGQNHQVNQLLQKAQQLLRQSKRRDYYKILGKNQEMLLRERSYNSSFFFTRLRCLS